MISLLIPTYNRSCYLLAKILAQQCSVAVGLEWEIIIVDDGSDDAVSIASNRWCGELDGVRIVSLESNVGRSAVRNRAVDEAKGDWVVLLDDDVMPVDGHFVERYVRLARQGHYDVVCGGVNASHKREDESSLRWIYDAYAEEKMTLRWRRNNPYRCFTTQNFMARRSVFDVVRFDESLQQYGYEDALLGVALQQHGFRIRHTPNPVEHLGIEPNKVFLYKTEKALQNLYHLGSPMTDYATVSRVCAQFKRFHMKWIVQLWHILFGRLERRILCGKFPSVHLFQLYKLGYYSRLR